MLKRKRALLILFNPLPLTIREAMEKEEEAKDLETPLPHIELKSPSVGENPSQMTTDEDDTTPATLTTEPSPAATVSVNA